MRVLYFTRDYTPHDHRFLSALAASGHEIYSLRLERRALRLEERPLPDGVTPVKWRGGEAPLSLTDLPALGSDLRRVLDTIKPDVVHAGPIQYSALLAAWVGCKPLVSMSWGSDLLLDTRRSLWSNLAARYTLRHTTVMVGDCQAVRRRAEEFGFPCERIVLFPWGVDLQHFSPQQPASTIAGWENCFVFLSLRTWEPLYGVDVVCRAFVSAAQKEPSLRLILLGSGSQEALLRHILEEGGVIERVHFGGQVGYADLPRYYRRTDVYVSASHSDGSSVSLMEALSCGAPALVSDIPGNVEWVTPGVEGWLFPDGDADLLSARMLEAFNKRDALPEMGRSARDLAEHRADWGKNFSKLLDAYELALRLQGQPKTAD